MGTFLGLKPFYINQATKKDMVMCCWKLHLQTRWSLQALSKCLSSQKIDFSKTYDFLSIFIVTVPRNSTHLHFDWTESPDKYCSDIESKWNALKSETLQNANDEIKTPFTEFKRLEVYKDGKLLYKKGKAKKRLVPVKDLVSTSCLVTFVDNLLA